MVSSAGVYGAGGDGGRLLGEGDTMRPVDPYGASKAAAEVWARQEASRTGQEIVCVRPFGHLGSRQSHRFVAANLARQLQRIQEGSQDRRLKVGNLSAVREFNNVRDIAAGCVAALDRGRSEEVYNLCSGKGMSIQALADDMCRVAGIEAECGVEKDRLRPVDIQCLVGDPEKSREALGWQPVIPWEETLAEVLSVHDQPA